MPTTFRSPDRAWLPGGGNPLARLLALRRLEVLSQSLVLLLAIVWLRMPLPVLPMAAIVAGLALTSLFSRRRLMRRGAVGESEIFAQLAIDTLALGLLLYFAGGSTNPFVSLLLMPPMLAAAMLPTRQAWAMALLALSTYSVLLLWNLPLPAPQRDLAALDDVLARVSAVNGAEHALHGSSFALHVLGMWLNFVVSLAVVALLLTRLASTLKKRERELAAAREAALHDEQILALGTLAAGAAHRLGTPLATMAVVLGELEHAYADDTALRQDLSLLRGQVDRCKQTLSQILASAGQQRGEALRPLAIDVYLRQLLDDWQLIRPRVRIDARSTGVSPAPMLVADGTLAQALLNLLDNAADAHGSQPPPLLFSAEWDADQCRIEILDCGPGLRVVTATRLGEAFFTTRPTGETASAVGGVGIGLFLSNATIQRFGGRVELFNRDGAESGACTRVTLPLSRPQEP